jgi:multidrug efflux pump subunit AcrA (membrane-fusion protein)
VRRRTWAPAVAVAAAAAGGAVAMSGAEQATPAPRDPAANTAPVQRGPLSAMVSQGGTLAYRARSDGSPYAVINQASGVYTRLPENGDRVDCGDVLYRVDEHPVVLLCGTVPAYRTLRRGDAGKDVRQLNRNLHEHGRQFTARTEQALKRLQRRTGLHVTGTLAVSQAVFLPEPVRVAEVTGELGAPARPGAPVIKATSNKLRVRVNLDPSQQGEVKQGDRAQIMLPGNTPVSGRVEGFGRVAQLPAEPDSKPVDATIPTYIGLDEPAKARGLDQAPVEVDITTKGVDDVLNVPVTALVGKAGGGFAVEVVRAGDRRELVAVTLGLFDTGGGRVQVDGQLRAGESVVVPSL